MFPLALALSVVHNKNPEARGVELAVACFFGSVCALILTLSLFLNVLFE
jgi:hypothetical protein